MSEKKTFEENLNRLEEIVRAMEKGDVPLDKSLELFQEGTALLQLCGRILDDAELQVAKVIPQASGEPSEVPFEEE